MSCLGLRTRGVRFLSVPFKMLLIKHFEQGTERNVPLSLYTVRFLNNHQKLDNTSGIINKKYLEVAMRCICSDSYYVMPRKCPRSWNLQLFDV